jgi:hypothetical protein
MRLGFAPFRGSNPRASAVHRPLPQARKEGAERTTGRKVATQRRAAEAHAAAVHVLASSVEAFRHAAEAHERAASMHDRTAAAGIGDARGHEQQAALHRSAAAADRHRAELARSLLSESQRAGACCCPW